MVAHYLINSSDFGNDPPQDVHGLPQISRRAGYPPIGYGHEDAAMDVQSHLMESDKRHYGQKNVVFLVRDVRDVVVSYYFELTRRRKRSRFDGSLSEFVRDSRYGAPKIVSYYRIWQRSSGIPRRFLAVSYEELRANTSKTLAAVLSAFGVQDIDDVAADAAIASCRFDRMRAMEQTGASKHHSVRAKDRQDLNTYKTRSGKVGGFVEHLNAADIKFIENCYADAGAPFSNVIFKDH